MFPPIIWPSSGWCFLYKKTIAEKYITLIHIDSCREIFRNMQILTLYSQYIFSLLLFTIKNIHLFTSNDEIHKYNTHNINNLHPASTTLTKVKNGPYVMGFKVFNHLPQPLKDKAHNPKQFKSSLKRFLYHHSFYSMEEYYEYKENTLWNGYTTFSCLLSMYYTYPLLLQSILVKWISHMSF